jgi:hypothetical protein
MEFFHLKQFLQSLLRVSASRGVIVILTRMAACWGVCPELVLLKKQSQGTTDKAPLSNGDQYVAEPPELVLLGDLNVLQGKFSPDSA